MTPFLFPFVNQLSERLEVPDCYLLVAVALLDLGGLLRDLGMLIDDGLDLVKQPLILRIVLL